MNYYETHTRDETCEHFNIFSQDVKEMCKEHGYKKPPNLYKIFATDKNPAKRDDVRLKLSQKAKERESKRRAALIADGTYYKLRDKPKTNRKWAKKYETYEIDSFTDIHNDIVDWCKCHTYEDTCSKFNINPTQLRKICKRFDYKKSEADILTTVNLKYGCTGGYFTSKDYEDKNIKRTFKMHSSVAENNWLDSLNIPGECRQIYVGNRLTVDALCGNTAYEYLGDYWHGNPKFLQKYIGKPCYESYKERLSQSFNETLNKFLMLTDMGFRIRYIWEGDEGVLYREFVGTLEY